MVERKHQHLLNVVIALLFYAHMPTVFWGSALLNVCYLVNKILVSRLHNKTLFEFMFHKFPSYTYLKSFGYLFYALNLISQRKHFDSSSKRCVFIGYTNGIKCYNLYDLEAKVYIISRDVFFYEELFPFYESVNNFIHVSNNSNFFLPIIPNIGISFPSSIGA